MRTMIVDGAFGPVTFTGFTDKGRNQPANEGELTAVETSVGRSLPDDYRAYLKTINGGTVEPRGVPYKWTPADIRVLELFLSPTDEIIQEPVALVAAFYAAQHQEPARDIQTALQTVVDWGQPGFLPIAKVSIGDFIVLDLNQGKAYGSVHYLTIHGVAFLEGTRHQIPLGYIAPNFTSFTKLFFDYDSVIDARVETLLNQHRP